MGDILPAPKNFERIEGSETRVNKYNILRKTVVTRSGASFTKRIRSVCRICNSGWMNRLEQKARPILTPLILGEPMTLTPAMRQTLAEWATMKFIVLEHAERGEFVTPERDRIALKETLTMPGFFRIWIFRCGTGGWEAGLNRISINLSLNGYLPPGLYGKNSQSITWGLGDLLFHHFATTVPNLRFDLTPLAKTYAVQLWPPVDGDINWPVNRRLEFMEAQGLAHSIEAQTRTLDLT
jgi:hypothetical protein